MEHAPHPKPDSSRYFEERGVRNGILYEVPFLFGDIPTPFLTELIGGMEETSEVLQQQLELEGPIWRGPDPPSLIRTHLVGSGEGVCYEIGAARYREPVFPLPFGQGGVTTLDRDINLLSWFGGDEILSKSFVGICCYVTASLDKG